APGDEPALGMPSISRAPTTIRKVDLLDVGNVLECTVRENLALEPFVERLGGRPDEHGLDGVTLGSEQAPHAPGEPGPHVSKQIASPPASDDAPRDVRGRCLVGYSCGDEARYEAADEARRRLVAF